MVQVVRDGDGGNEPIHPTLPGLMLNYSTTYAAAYHEKLFASLAALSPQS